MAGSTFGTLFRITTWGESHGPALGVVVDGCPAGIPLTTDYIQAFLDRRNLVKVNSLLPAENRIQSRFFPAFLKGIRPEHLFLS